MAIGKDDRGLAVATSIAAVAGEDRLQGSGRFAGVIYTFIRGDAEVYVSDEGEAEIVGSVWIVGSIVWVKDVAAFFTVNRVWSERNQSGLCRFIGERERRCGGEPFGSGRSSSGHGGRGEVNSGGVVVADVLVPARAPVFRECTFSIRRNEQLFALYVRKELGRPNLWVRRWSTTEGCGDEVIIMVGCIDHQRGRELL